MEITLERCCEILREMEDIAIICHRNPDGDTLGSGFALYYIFKQLRKRSRVFCHDEIPPQYSYLLLDYQEEDFKPKNVVAVDIADEQLFGENLECFKERADLCIDHHGTNKHYAKETLLRENAAANCETFEEIVNGLAEVKLTKTIANCIYTGISTDTGCFCYSNTTAKTHEIAGRMIQSGCDYAMINRVMFEIKSLSRIALEKEVLNTVEYHFGAKCALIYITNEMMERTGADKGELEGVASIPRKIEGVEVGITLRQRDNGYKISLRTGDEVDASALCQKLGGGGHRYAGGCFVEGSLEGAKKAILKVVEESL